MERGLPISKVNPDIICLQEVRSKTLAEEIACKVEYPYVFFDNYSDEKEGLCTLSKCAWTECESWMEDTNAIYGSVLWNQKRIAVVNLHLPWNRVSIRQKQIRALFK